MKPEAYLAIVQERRIQERIQTEVHRAVMADRERLSQDLSAYADVLDKLDKLLDVLNEVRWTALYARGIELETAMQGKIEKISGLLAVHLDSVEKWRPNGVTAQTLTPPFSRWVGLVLRGVQRCDRVHPKYDGGESLRGLWSDEQYRAAVAYRDMVNRGGAPIKPWRPVLAEEIQARTIAHPELGLKEIVQGLITEMEARQGELDETRDMILAELKRRNPNTRMKLVRTVLGEYQNAQKPVFGHSERHKLP